MVSLNWTYVSRLWRCSRGFPQKCRNPKWYSSCSVMSTRHFPCQNWCTGSNFLDPAPAPRTPQNVLLMKCPAIAAGQAS
eukprot:1145905-Pelagomonas_calceolata.AAC.6